MAFLTTGAAAIVEFKPQSDSAWSVLTPIPGIPPAFAAQGIYSGGLIPVYVVDASIGQVSTIGGIGFGFDDTLLVTSSTSPMTTFTMTTSGGLTLTWLKTVSSAVYVLNPDSQMLGLCLAADVGALKSFLP